MKKDPIIEFLDCQQSSYKEKRHVDVKNEKDMNVMLDFHWAAKVSSVL